MTRTHSRLYWHSTGIPEEHWDRAVEDLQPLAGTEESVEKVRRWVDGVPDRQNRQRPAHPDWGVGFSLAGGPGSGKTTLAASALVSVRTLFDRSVMFTDFPEFLNLARQNATDSFTEAWDQRRYLTAQKCFLLCLDDVGAERHTDSGFAAEELRMVLRGRFRVGRPTIVTSNLSPSQWVTRYGEANQSFMYQACPAMNVTGDDWRKAKARAGK